MHRLQRAARLPDRRASHDDAECLRRHDRPENGQLINPGAARGTETDNVFALGLAFQEGYRSRHSTACSTGCSGRASGFSRSATNYANFDFHRDVDKVDDQLADDAERRQHGSRASSTRRGNKLLMYHGWADPLIPAAEQHQLLQRAGENDAAMTRQASSRSASAGHDNPALRRPELCPSVHGAGHVPLRRRPRPQRVRCADAAGQLGRAVAWRRRRSSPPNSSTIRRRQCR